MVWGYLIDNQYVDHIALLISYLFFVQIMTRGQRPLSR